MALQPAVCTNCGGKIKVDDIDLNGFGKCKHCKTPFKVIDVITIDGLPSAKSLLLAAEHSMQDENYEKAVSLFNEILTIKPNCHEAWWGLYTCNAYFDEYYNYEDKYGNKGSSTKAKIMNDTLQKYAFRAIEYAPKDVVEKYRGEIKECLDFIKSAKNDGYDKQTNKKSGCYIATAVYGSYDCDEVLKLRRFRDDYLASFFLGKLFICFYYIVSPLFAKHLHANSKTGKVIRRLLDKIITRM